MTFPPSRSPSPGPGPGPGIRPYLYRPPAPAQEPEREEAPQPRPFILTAGRVRAADPEIRLETQVTARIAGAGPPWPAVPLASLPTESRAIVALCTIPVSVAEISARLRLHLGVTRILVSDLRAAGHLEVHTLDVADPHDPETIMRVIRGLRAIS